MLLSIVGCQGLSSTTETIRRAFSSRDRAHQYGLRSLGLRIRCKACLFSVLLIANLGVLFASMESNTLVECCEPRESV